MTLSGWGLKINLETKTYGLTDVLKVMSLEVKDNDECERLFTPEALKKDGALIGSVELRKLEKFKNGFTSEIACVGHPFDISQGNKINHNQKLNFHHTKTVLLFRIL